MILLHCMCLSYKQIEFEEDSLLEELLHLYLQVKGPSLITFEEKPEAEDVEVDENGSKKDESLSEHSRTNIGKNEDTPHA